MLYFSKCFIIAPQSTPLVPLHAHISNSFKFNGYVLTYKNVLGAQQRCMAL